MLNTLHKNNFSYETPGELGKQCRFQTRANKEYFEGEGRGEINHKKENSVSSQFPWFLSHV